MCKKQRIREIRSATLLFSLIWLLKSIRSERFCDESNEILKNRPRISRSSVITHALIAREIHMNIAAA